MCIANGAIVGKCATGATIHIPVFRVNVVAAIIVNNTHGIGNVTNRMRVHLAVMRVSPAHVNIVLRVGV